MNRRRALLTILSSTEESVDTYSGALRELNKQDSESTMLFMKEFKDAFDNALEQGAEDHQDVALQEANKVLAEESKPRIIKLAQTAISTSNDPNEIGKTVAEIVKIILARMTEDRGTVYNNMRNKILSLNVAEISGTNLPETAAYGQSLTLIKTLLSGYDAQFVQQVLVSASNHLV
jgi:flagellar biosynthesis/type III secretory pathway protein FliH